MMARRWLTSLLANPHLPGFMGQQRQPGQFAEAGKGLSLKNSVPLSSN